MNQILSQDEINALLSGLSDGEIETDVAKEAPKEGTRNYDLASQERIIRGRMPTMELIHDRFARSLRVALSKFLSRTCYVNVGAVEIVKYGQFMKKLQVPSSLHVYRMPPLHGFAMMVVSTPLVFSVVDTLFGGKGGGKVKIEGREYTAIETRLIGKFTMICLEILKEAWLPVHPVDFVYVRSELNPGAVTIVPQSDVVIVVTMEIELESESTTLTICTPYSTLEPIRQKLTTGLQSTRLELDNTVIRRMELNVRRSEVNVSVELAHGTVAARDIADLKPGDIIPLETSPTDEATLKVEGRCKYHGFVGSSRGSRAIRITRPYVDAFAINYGNK